MPPNPSFNWSKLQNVYYNIRILNDELKWNIDNIYNNYQIALSPNSTLIALASKSNNGHPNLIEIYSTSGIKISSIIYNSSNTDYINTFLFKEEDLVVILNNGKYRYYDDLMGNFNEFNFLDGLNFMTNIKTEAKEDVNSRLITNLENNETEEIINIIEVKIFQQFMFIRLENKLIITDLDNYVNYEIPLGGYSSVDITTFTISESQINFTYKNTIITIKIDLLLNSYEFIDQELTDGPFNKISISPNGKLISLQQQKKIFVISSKYDQVLLEYDCSNESSLPYQIEWCGNDAIILSFKDEIKLIGPSQQSISFFYDIEDEEEFDLNNLLTTNLDYTIPILQTCSDGLRIITSNKIQILSRVSDKFVDMYQIGSTEPSSLLVDCIDKFQTNASKSNANISLLQNENLLLKAIDDCLDVALEEFNVIWQKRSLKAVSFGKIYYNDVFDSDKYLNVLNSVKVLNQLRSPEIGLFLTYNEILEIGWENVIKMLLRRNQHALAIKIIEILKLSNVKPLVYIHWCCYKIRKEMNMSDEELYKIIYERLTSMTKGKNLISVEAICDIADEEGRTNLCKLLINLEPNIIEKILKYIEFDNLELALIKSFQFGDFDLMISILYYLQNKLSISQFFKILNQNEIIESSEINEILPISGELLGSNWSKTLGKSSEYLEKFLKHEDKSDELIYLRLNNFWTSENSDYYNRYKELLTKYANKSKIKRIQRSFSRELQVLDLQKKMNEIYQTESFYNETSLVNILIKLIKMNQIKTCQKVIKEFNISQEKLWFLILNTYSTLEEFDRLYEFAFGSMDSITGKSPIGFEPFVDSGFKNGAPKSHISTYINNSTKYKYGEKVNLFIKNDDFEGAANEAFKNKDIEILKHLEKLNPVDRLVKSYIQKLGY
ncbi:unnamed protein product [Candida verbasci]|uniref:Probable vacuolar protein sorting-associated protein 16 homolog n=1 Tax=Candida verbasci TaxID=1227364 RepID=A0A9W4XCS5_9ASCO|nr:unnamed protein product [Candida verbasci]